MEKWIQSWKKIKLAGLCAGVLTSLLTAVLAWFDSAEGGILRIVSAVLFDTYLSGVDGWPINLHAGGMEGFSVMGYYVDTYYFLLGLALTAVSLIFIWVRPAKMTMLLYVAAVTTINIYLSMYALWSFNPFQFLPPLLVWGLVICSIVFLCRNWRGIQRNLF